MSKVTNFSRDMVVICKYQTSYGTKVIRTGEPVTVEDNFGRDHFFAKGIGLLQKKNFRAKRRFER